jgi:RNA polymerase sigma-70 factor (ECF subfamily)
MTISCENPDPESSAVIDADAALLSVMEFMRQVCRNLLGRFPDVQRWDQTDDIFQQAALKLHRALQEAAPESRRHLENLAALQVRRTLIDLGRTYATRVAMNQQRWTPLHNGADFCGINAAQAAGESDPQGLMEWVELHEQIEKLPHEEQEVFQLIWYRGLPKDKVAKLLGVDVRTVQRRWRAARETLSDCCGGVPPL